MAVNQFFKNTLQGGTSLNEFNLFQDLIIESIKIHGYDVQYLPRTLVNEDDLYGEDVASTFTSAPTIEMYIKDVEGFGGEGDILSRIGLEIRDQITFSVSQKRFSQMQTESVISETGYNWLSEQGDKILSEGDEGYTLSLIRPNEGDLIYFPLTNKIYEVRFVEHEEVFYQLGKLYTYELRCELFEFSNETIATGNSSIDSIQTRYSTNMLESEFLMEDGNKVMTEDGSSIILESYRIEDFDLSANNELFTAEINTGNLIDFDENNPFGERRY
jgi:hypothetical protein